MARIKYGGIITDISGSVGGSTFQKSLFGNTLRNKPIPHKSATPSQLIVRSNMMQLHAAWSGLTNDQRLQWNRFINFSGQTIRKDSGVTMTGHDLFIKYNMFRLISGLSPLGSFVYKSDFPMSTFSFTFNWGISLIGNFRSIMNPSQSWFLLKVSSIKKPSIVFSPIGLLYIPVPVVSLIDFDITPIYRTLFGLVPVSGECIHYSIRFFSTISPIYSNVYTGIQQLIYP
jgi:hypothetical protein